jgi:hypothetical protein
VLPSILLEDLAGLVTFQKRSFGSFAHHFLDENQANDTSIPKEFSFDAIRNLKNKHAYSARPKSITR